MPRPDDQAYENPLSALMVFLEANDIPCPGPVDSMTVVRIMNRLQALMDSGGIDPDTLPLVHAYHLSLQAVSNVWSVQQKVEWDKLQILLKASGIQSIGA